jgi:cysteine desulfurase
VINGIGAPRVCNTANVQFCGIDGHALLARLDQRGVVCSQSSACTNRRPEPSYVLRAMGLTEDQAYASVRFSFSELNSEADVDFALEIIVEEVAEMRRFSGSAVFAA